MHIDATLKRIFQRPPNLLLSQATGETIVVVRSLPTESILIEKVQPDVLFETTTGEIVHAELHGYGMRKFAIRNLIYFGLILRDYDKPPTQIVFWVANDKAGVTDGLDFPPNLNYRYLLVDVRTIDGGPLLESTEMGEAIFSILCKHPDNEAAVRRIVERIRELPEESKAEAVAELLILSGLRGLTETVQAEVARVPLTIEVQDNEFLKQVWEQGERLGREEGERNEAMRSLLDILTLRFGPPTDEVRLRIERAELTSLREWTRRAIMSEGLTTVFE